MCARQRAYPGRRIACSKNSSEVFGKSDETAVLSPDHVVAAGARGQRRVRVAILAETVEIEFAIERMQVVILADFSLDSRCGGAEVQKLVVPPPRIFGKIQ